MHVCVTGSPCCTVEKNKRKKTAIMRGKYKCKILKMHLKLRDQQPKAILYIQILLYQNVMGRENQKTTIDTLLHTHTHTHQKQTKYNTKDHHQIQGNCPTITNAKK